VALAVGHVGGELLAAPSRVCRIGGGGVLSESAVGPSAALSEKTGMLDRLVHYREPKEPRSGVPVGIQA
jgi:hypothetical protein